MATYYLDTSALLKLYIEEPGTDRVIAVAESPTAGQLVILDVTLVESRSAVRKREGDISRLEANQIVDRIDGDVSSVYLVQPGSSVVQEAARLIDSHPPRALDALQLAGCLSIRHHTPPPLTFVCADALLCDVANLEGLATIDPLNDTPSR